MTGDLFDLLQDEPEVTVAVDSATGAPEVLSFSVELPHPDATLVVMRPQWDGTWSVSMRDRYGVGFDSMQTATAVDPLTASRMIAAPLVAAIEARIEKNRTIEEAAAARRAALGAGATYPSGRSVTTAVGPRRGHPPESQTVTGPYTGSVPRNALVWDVSSAGVRVQLKSGLVWADVGGSEERVFRTVRLAKDNTRGAVSG